MKYVIMCGGWYGDGTPRQLWKINGEEIVARTIRLLREAGADDIAISTHDERFAHLGVPILHHENRFDVRRQHCTWIDAFYPAWEPICYVFGDVAFSPEAIQEIVNTDTDDIEFFASAPPFSSEYIKPWAEPFAFKVVDQEKFGRCLHIVQVYYIENRWKREPIAWELWQVIKGTHINYINYNNYHAINDYTCDIDSASELERITKIIQEKEGNNHDKNQCAGN